MKSCPRCGASNPAENKFCGTCGSLLVPPTPPSDDLPPWLTETAPSSTTTAPATPATDQELPAWLSEVGVDDPPSGSAETAQAPDWLAQLQQETPTAPQHQNTASDLPDWLREIGSDNGSTADTPGTNGVPAWDQQAHRSGDNPSPALSSSQADELPAWLQLDTELDVQATQPMNTAPAASSTNDELPAWLSGYESSPTTAEASPPAQDALPAWLTTDEQIPPPTSTPASAATDELPPWLRFDDDATGSPTGKADLAPSNHSAWMQADDPAADVRGSTAHPPVDELPAWLRSDDSTPDLVQPAATSAQTTALPDWLNSDDVIVEPAAPPAPAQELPAWLQDSTQEPSQPQATSTQNIDWLSADDQASTGDVDMPVPDWGSEFGELPTNQRAAQDTLPDWLADTSFDQPNTHQTPSNDAPAWLLEESPTAPATSETQAFNVAGAEPGSDALPNWLMESSSAAALPPNDQAMDTIPPWLMDQDATADQPEQPNADQATTGATEELPAWLRDDAVTSTATSTTSSDDLPSWLQSTDEPAPAASGSDTDIPDWLALPDSPADQPGGAHIYESPSSENDLPAWLQSDDGDADTSAIARTYDAPNASDAQVDIPDEQSGGARTYDVPADTHTAQLPAWLSEDAAPASAAPPQSDDADLPAWLSGIAPEETSAPPPATTNLPSWLDEPQQTAGTNAKDEPQSEFVTGVELPAWLRESTDMPAAATPVVETAPTWLQRVTPETEAEDTPLPQPVEEQPPTPRVVRSAERIASMQLLQQLRDEPAPEPVTQPRSRHRSWIVPLLLFVIAAAMIAVLVYILLNNRLLNFGVAPADPPAVARIVQTVQNIPANRPVVLAYEWNAQRASEIRPLEEAVIGQLAERTDVPLVFLSTDPQGVLLSNERAAQIQALGDNFHDQYGLGFVNLGYKAGGALALRRFASNPGFGELFAQDVNGIDFRTNTVTIQSICGVPAPEQCSWDNVGMLVVMADEVDDVRGWFEQVRSEHPNLQTLLLIPSEIAPQVQPYSVLPNVQALAGLADAEAYFRARGITNEALGRQRDAVAVGSAFFAVLALAGAVPAYLNGRRARRHGEEDVWGR